MTKLDATFDYSAVTKSKTLYLSTQQLFICGVSIPGRWDSDVLDRTIWCFDLLFTLITLDHGCRADTLTLFLGSLFAIPILPARLVGLDHSPFNFGMPAQ